MEDIDNSAGVKWAPLVWIALLRRGGFQSHLTLCVAQSVTATPHAKLETLSKDFYDEHFDPVGWLVVSCCVKGGNGLP